MTAQRPVEEPEAACPALLPSARVFSRVEGCEGRAHQPGNPPGQGRKERDATRYPAPLIGSR